MAVKAKASITLSFMIDVTATYRYYKLQASTASTPSVPTTRPPSGWIDTEPSYTSGSTNTLYFVDCTVFSNNTYLYSSVSKSSSYEAAKEAYNKAVAAQNTIDNMEIGGTNLITKAHLRQTELKAYDTYTYVNTTTGSSHIFNGVYLEPGDYILSIWLKRSADIDVARIRLYKSGTTIAYYSNNRTDGEWGLVTIPITSTSVEDSYGAQVYNHNFAESFDPEVSVKKIKIERGNKATDWSPAPVDMASYDDMASVETRVTTAETNIIQNSNSITSVATRTTNNESSISVLQQTSDGLTVRLDEAETDISTAQTTANNAAKTATNYLKYSSSGLVVANHTASTLGKNVLIDSDSVDIRNGNTTLASFAAKKVTLGQNAVDSVIDLCDGAGTISALASEAATSYPEYDSIKVESQEILLNGQTVTAYTKSKTPSTYTNEATMDLLSYNGSTDGSFAQLNSTCTIASSGAESRAGVSSFAYDTANQTRLLIHSSFDGTYNQMNMYPTYTKFEKPIKIGSDNIEFTGDNKILWSGSYYMLSSQSITLSEAISSQVNGIVLMWSYYVDGSADNSNFNTTFIPKQFVSSHNGKGIAAFLTNSSMSKVTSKYVYVSNTTITGHANNSLAATVTDSGITVTPKSFVLRYVIGV